MTDVLAVIGAAWIMTIGATQTSGQAVPATRSVWDGVYSADQATRGKEQYTTHCSMCHIADLRGDGMAPGLVGDDFMLQWSDLSANDLFTRTRNSMPQDNPRSLADDVYLDILTYVFQANKFPAGNEDLKADATTLKAIKVEKRK